MINVKHEVEQATIRLTPHVRHTPLERSFVLSDAGNCTAFLKLENLQVTGSFKVRGALNTLLTLAPSEADQGIITASTGNHGLAVAYALQRLGLQGTIYLPHNASSQKIMMLQHYGVPLRLYGRDAEETEAYARAESERRGQVYISPYNDPHIIGGQGTIAAEVLQEFPAIDYIFVAVGGGGLIAGIAGYLKAMSPQVTVVGCLPRNSPVMYESIKAGRIIRIPTQPTVSDGTAGGIEPGALTLALCQHYVDEWVLVDEREIHQAMRLIFEHHRLVVEGAAGVAIAAFLQSKAVLEGKQVVVVVCGGNIDVETFKGLVF